MKNLYEDKFNQLHLKEEYKHDIFMHVMEYDLKKGKKQSITPKIVVATLALLLVITVPVFLNTIKDKNKENPYSIKANNDAISLSNNEITIQDFTQHRKPHYIATMKPSIAKIETDPFYFPLSVYIEGDKIESITYTIKNGKFYKIDEIVEISSENMPSAGGWGFGKIPNSFPALIKEGNTLPGDETKPLWWYNGKSKDGNEITIPYEDQNTVDGLYGISFYLIDRELINILSGEGYGSTPTYYDNLAISKMIDVINNSKLDVRINYKNGTYKVTQLGFKINEQGNFEVKK